MAYSDRLDKENGGKQPRSWLYAKRSLLKKNMHSLNTIPFSPSKSLLRLHLALRIQELEGYLLLKESKPKVSTKKRKSNLG